MNSNLYLIHRIEQIEACQFYFELAWSKVIELEPWRNNMEDRYWAWRIYFDEKLPHVPKPPHE